MIAIGKYDNQLMIRLMIECEIIEEVVLSKQSDYGRLAVSSNYFGVVICSPNSQVL